MANLSRGILSAAVLLIGTATAMAQTVSQEETVPPTFKVGGASGVTMGKTSPSPLSVGSPQVEGAPQGGPKSSMAPSRPRPTRLSDKTQGNCDGLNRRRVRFQHGCGPEGQQ